MDDPESGRIKIAGCSVTGPAHEETGTGCQDAYDYDQFGDDRFVFAVGDGLGSATYSHLGSEKATETVTELLTERLEAVDEINKSSTEKVFAEVFTETRTAIQELAENEEASADEFATTLLAVVAGDSGLAGATVGDGGLIYGCDGEYDVVVPHESTIVNLGADHITYPITSNQWKESYRFNCLAEFETVAAFSDGLSQHAWEHFDAPNATFFDKAFDILRNTTASKDAEKQLRTAFNTDNFRRFGDDKTLVMGLLESQEENSTLGEGIVSIDTEVVAVDHRPHEVSLKVSVPGNGIQTTSVLKPPAWQITKCTLKTLLHRYDVDLRSTDDLVGESIPCRVDTESDPVKVAVDSKALLSESPNIFDVKTKQPNDEVNQ